jgi:CO/xanthine dehydrogenase Mo-binding subunit
MTSPDPASAVHPAATAVETPLIVPPDTVVPGRARGLPLRREGVEKLTGLARYTDDLVTPDGWYGATVRSTVARARLLGIDRDPAFDWSQVIVVTAADIPGENIVSSIKSDQPALAHGEISHHAEPIALLAAPDRATLRAARRALQVRLEPLEPVLDPERSEQQFAAYQVARGDVEAALAQADLVIEGEYRVGHQEQLYIEPNAMIAAPRPDGGITITGSMQCPYYVHNALRRALGLTKDQAVIIQAETGGGFGGKEDYPSMIAIHAALLAQKAGRPVRMIYDRHEDIAATTKRHPAIIRSRTGVMRDGTLVAQDIEVVMDGGAYCTLTPVVLSRGILHATGPYPVEHVRVRGRAMATNTPPNGAFRGFGAPQTEFAAELQVARVADALGVSPAELRRRWAYRPGDTTPTGQVLIDSVAAVAVLDAAVEASEYERVRARTRAARETRTERDRLAPGVGIALAWHGAGFTGSGEDHLASVAGVELRDDATIRVLIANTEIGQGTKTIFPMLAGEALGVADADVELAPQDTSVVPDSGPTVASRTAMVVGGLVVQAARALREQVESATGRPFAESYRDHVREHGAVRVDRQYKSTAVNPFDDRTYTGDAYPAFGWAAAVAEVDVDLDTGEVLVRAVVSADDAGRIIHPLLAEGQVEGGTLQAVGYATIEEIKLKDGRYLNDRLATCLIPTSVDAPRITAILVEAPFAGVPHGAKGIGELPMDVVAPAIVDAIHDALGAWVTELPATPERILEALGVTE